MYPKRRDPKTKELYYAHRAIAALALGRPLKEGEVVHHEDGDVTNNHVTNLWVFASQADHARYHALLRKLERGDVSLWPIEDLLELKPKRLGRRL